MDGRVVRMELKWEHDKIVFLGICGITELEGFDVLDRLTFIGPEDCESTPYVLDEPEVRT